MLDHLRRRYPGFYFVSSTTKVLTDFAQFEAELKRPEFRFVVPDFRLNWAIDRLCALPDDLKQKVEFLLYYMTNPEHQLRVREEIYLDSSLDLF